MRTRARIGPALMALLLATIAVPGPAGAANLIRNWSFETGTFASWARNAQVGISSFLHHRTGTRSVAVLGDNGAVLQRVAVGAFSSRIDAGQAAVTTGCYHAGYEPVYVSATFLNGAGKAISGKAVAGAPPMTFATWKRLALVRTPVPPLTRTIRLQIRVKDVPGNLADTNWDDAFMFLVER